MLGAGKARKEGTRRILPAAEESLNATGLPNYQQVPVLPKDPIIAPQLSSTEPYDKVAIHEPSAPKTLWARADKVIHFL